MIESEEIIKVETVIIMYNIKTHYKVGILWFMGQLLTQYIMISKAMLIVNCISDENINIG